MKHGGGGGVMVWGAFCSQSIRTLHEIEGIMNGEVYCDILKDILLPYVCKGMPRGWLFQHDNDPKHRCGLVTKEL